MLRPLTLVLIAWLISGACEWPFDTTPKPSDNPLGLDFDYDGRRIVDTLHLQLKWQDLTVEFFSHYLIERKNLTKNEGKWSVAGIDSNAFALSFIDTVTDDAAFLYRLSIVDEDGDKLISENQITLRPTTHLYVPAEVDSLHQAPPLDLMDDGDTVFVAAGKHITLPVAVGQKQLTIIGMGGAQATFLELPDTLSVEDEGKSVLTLSRGLVKGFTIIHNAAGQGGAIQANGGARISQCYLGANVSAPTTRIPRGGQGGGVYLADSASIVNSVIYLNQGSLAGGIFVRSSSWGVQIINCTIVGNSIYGVADAKNGFATIKNTIFLNNAGRAVYLESTDTTLTVMAYSIAPSRWSTPGSSLYDSTNITVDPALADIMFSDFSLLPGSPAIDAGDPDPAFNDPDGTRNDMGAFGGPEGDWNTPVGLQISLEPGEGESEQTP